MRSGGALFLAVVVACSSTTSTPAPGDGGTASSSSSSTGGSSSSSSSSSGGTSSSSSSSGSPGGKDASTDGGFDLTFTNTGANTTRTAFKVAPVMGAFCQGASPNKACSFTASITDGTTGCTAILNAAFVGDPTDGAAYPIAVDPTTPPGKGEISYTETCNGGATKMWKATAGTLTLGKVIPPSPGLVTGTLSFTIQGATMDVAPAGAGDAQGTFSVAGSASDVTYTSTS
jgi:hypothetical protein